jgi:hypothetical protein
MTKGEYYNLIEPTRFSRSWWAAGGRSLLWVTLVTVLLWTYADVEFTDEMELGATIQLIPARDLVLQSESRIRVNFKVQGRRSSLEALEQRLLAPEAVIPCEVSEGDEDLSAREALNRTPLLQNEGLTVLSASPRVLRIRLDRRTYQPDIPVKFEYTGAFASEVVIEPPRMGLHVARSDWEKLLKAEPKPVLRTVSVDLKAVPSDKPFTVELVRRIADLPVEPDQPTVTVRVKIAQLTETEEIPVPVQVVMPPAWLEDGTWKDYALKRQDPQQWRPKIKVSGTRKDLDKLRAENVRAYVVLTDDDKKPIDSWLSRQVEVRLPRELNLTLGEERPQVAFRLEKLPSRGGP